MAKKKTVEVTLNREVLPNGNIKLTSIQGVKDIRDDSVYSEVICKQKYEHYFKEAGEESNEPSA